MDNFNLRKFLTENKLTSNSRAINERGEYKNNKDKVSTDKVIKYISSQESELKKNPKLWGAVQFFMGQLDNPETDMFTGYNGDKSRLDSMVGQLEDENMFASVINKAFDAAATQDDGGANEAALNVTASAKTLKDIIYQLLDDGHIQPETADDLLNAVSNSPSDDVYEANK